MRLISLWIPIIMVATLLVGCDQSKEVAEDNTKVIDVVATSEEQVEPPLPPEVIKSKFTSLQGWLNAICDNEKPPKPNLDYHFGLFESPNDFTLVLAGVHKYDTDKNHSVSKIEFEPANMYFPLPKTEYKGLTIEQVRLQLTRQLEDFTKTDKFKHSFFKDASSIITDWQGIIWKRNQALSK